jgi:predicted flap endonuclease-1-like 5' DNA nuclease
MLVVPLWVVDGLKRQHFVSLLAQNTVYIHPLQAAIYNDRSSFEIKIRPVPVQSALIERNAVIRGASLLSDDTMPKHINLNAHITDYLDELQAIYAQQNDEWRSLAYKKCSNLLSRMPRVNTIEDLKGIKGIGKSMAAKINEIIEDGTVCLLKRLQSDPKIAARNELSKIWGVGPRKAGELIALGLLTVEDVRQKGLHLLNYQQTIGLQLYVDLNYRIPRAEVQLIGAIVEQRCKRYEDG